VDASALLRYGAEVNAEGKEGWSRYDAELDVIETDVSFVEAASTETIDAIFDELEAIAAMHPHRYVLACWRETKIMDQIVAAHYGIRTTRLLAWVNAVVRYAANDPLTRAMVRTQAIKHVAAGMRSNLYETRAEALSTIAEMRRLDRDE